MKLDVITKTTLTQEEWDILCKASNVLDQLCFLLEDYDNELEIVSRALSYLEEVMREVVDDHE